MSEGSIMKLTNEQIRSITTGTVYIEETENGLAFHRYSKEQEEFVYSHVKPKYDKNCIFMYQSIISN